MSSWKGLATELRKWREAGRTPDLWWRDDDAATLTPALERLLALARKSGVPLALAVVPELAQMDALAEAQRVIMHGCDHRNRAASGEKKTEFPESESDDAALARLARARARLAELAGARFIGVLAPPWNRLRESLVPRLPEAGLRGLSRYGARRASGRSLLEVNTHVDIIAWRRDRGFVGEEEALALLLQHLAGRRQGALDAVEPTGLLTHHALHDAQAWRFVERLFDETRAAGALWRDPVRLFTSPA
jgi:peptidoglycan/xylan/chitin deacetylase (PgdA/CDA1 family)